jgi:hypothetical protein
MGDEAMKNAPECRLMDLAERRAQHRVYKQHFGRNRRILIRIFKCFEIGNPSTALKEDSRAMLLSRVEPIYNRRSP